MLARVIAVSQPVGRTDARSTDGRQNAWVEERRHVGRWALARQRHEDVGRAHGCAESCCDDAGLASAIMGSGSIAIERLSAQ